jgi:Fuc2NAc and GlcNAc transferase
MLIGSLGALGSLVISVAMTRFLIGNAWRRGRLDIPNERSSHSAPTPRGGGLAIILGFVFGILFLSYLAPKPDRILVVCLISCLAVATVGWWDDRCGLSAGLRLLVHLLSSAATAIAIERTYGSPRDLVILGPVLATVAAALFIASLVNLYNFMDGTDGLAGSEAVTVSLISAAFAISRGYQILGWIYLFLALASLGFLFFNWPPARIFMGDVASGFLGFIFAALSLAADASGALPLPVSLILLGTFVVDSSWTLVRRTLAGERPWIAHRDHAYQHAARSGLGHRGVALGNIAIILLWLAPLALAALRWPEHEYLLLALAYTPLIGIELRFHAGVRDVTESASA